MDYSGIDAKLDRAIAKINDLYGLIGDYRRLKPYSVRVETQSHEGDQFVGRLVTMKNKSLQPPDPNMVMLAGEILYQLRSALDHLICQLVIENGFGHTIETHRKHQFPIFETPDGYKRRSGAMTRDVPQSAHLLIEREQPYFRSAGSPRNDLLWLLSELNNTDKHRLIPIALVGIDVINVKDNRGRIGLLQSPDIELEDENVIWTFSCRLEPGDQISPDLSCTVAFKQAQSPYGSTLGMDGVLLDMAHRVGQIRDKFRSDFP